MTIGKEGNQYTRQEFTAADRESGKEFIEGIRRFVESHTLVIPVPGILAIEQGEGERFMEAIGLSAVASVIAATENQALLYSDNLVLRELASRTEVLGRVNGVSSLSILAILREREILPEDKYREAITKLMLANYHFVSLDAETLMWVFRKYGMTATPEVVKVFSNLNGTDCDERSATVVAANLTRKAWLELDYLYQKKVVLDLIEGSAKVPWTTGRVTFRAGDTDGGEAAGELLTPTASIPQGGYGSKWRSLTI